MIWVYMSDRCGTPGTWARRHDTRTLILVAPLTDFSKELDMLSLEAQWSYIKLPFVGQEG